MTLPSIRSDQCHAMVWPVQVVKFEKLYDDVCRLHMYLKKRDDPVILLFTDTSTREKFYIHAVNLLENPQLSAMVALSVRANGSITKESEEKKDKMPSSVSLFVGSWNLGNSPVNADQHLHAFVPPRDYDIYVVGFQECSTMTANGWLTHFKNHILDGYDGKPDDAPYVHVTTVKLWEIIILVMVRQKYHKYITNIESSSVACGIGGVLANKVFIITPSLSYSSSPHNCLIHMT
jgi:hypothetical protein